MAAVVAKEPWDKSIINEINKRNTACYSHFGPGFEYVLPVKNPFEKYRDVDDFKAKTDFDNYLKPKGVDCKLKPYVDDATDGNRRYYKYIRTKDQCKRAGGQWNPNDVHRYNKYDTGTCWTNADDARCGEHGVVELLRPSVVKKLKREGKLDEYVERGKQRCEVNDGCLLAHPTEFAYDCFTKKRAKTVTGVVMVPPDDFPKDVTDPKNKAGDYLYDWYVDKKHGKPPKTATLMGEGNRCTRNTTQARAKLDQPNRPKSKYTLDQITKLDPFNDINVDHIKQFLEELNVKYPTINKIVEQSKRHYSDYKRATIGKSKKIEHPIERVYRLLNTDNDNDNEIDAFDENMGMPSVPQSIVNMVMKNIANNPDSTNRGLLVWSSVGSGKTICAAGVMEAFWDSKKEIIFASSLDALASNPPSKFHEGAMKIFPRFQSKEFVGADDDETLVNVSRAFETRGVRFLSFAKLSNRVKKFANMAGGCNECEMPNFAIGGARTKKIVDVPVSIKRKRKTAKVVTPEPVKRRGKSVKKTKKDIESAESVESVVTKKANVTKKTVKSTKIDTDVVDLNNTILIIDEVHNLFRPEYNQAAEHKYLEDQLINPTKYPGLKIVVLTATPGDNIPDVVKLINIVRDVKKSAIQDPNPSDQESLEKFKKDITGLVSYFEMSGDRTKFPIVTDSIPVKVKMSAKQFERYKIAYLKDTTKEQQDFEKLAKDNKTSKYWSPARKYANTFYNFDKGLTLEEFSAKLPKLISTINQFPLEKHYVYSAFSERRGYGGHGVIAVGKEMDKLGYVEFTVKEAEKFNATGTLPDARKRYVMAISKELEKGKGSVGDNFQQIIKIYNHASNKNGELIHVMLASNKFNEGIDLKAVRHIHFFEPLVTMASDKQTIGRAARNCSHSDLDRDKGEWVVSIHRYMNDMPIIDVVRPVIDEGEPDKLVAAIQDIKNKMAQETDKTVIKSIKVQIKQLETQHKLLLKELGAKKKMDAANIRNVEEFVFKESRDRMKDLLVIYHAMREAALDCKVLQAFHSTSEYPVKCMV